MDLLSLMAAGAGADTPDITETLTAMNPAGDLLFKHPFGDTTKWVTETGCVSATVLFDPFLPWSQANLLASTTDNYILDIRRALGEFLVPESMMSQKPDPTETMWVRLKANLPDRCFQDYLKETDDNKTKNMDKYIEFLKSTVEKEYKEENALVEAITTKEFRFTYHLAVDAYPQDHAKKGKRKQQNATSNERLGVLVFHINGKPQEKVDEKNSAKVGISCDSESNAEPIPDEGRPRSPSKPTLRRHDDDMSNKSQRNLEELMTKLDIDSEKIEQGHNEWLKKFPDTATDFFDQLRSWFSTLLARKQAQLANKEEVEGMYR